MRFFLYPLFFSSSESSLFSLNTISKKQLQNSFTKKRQAEWIFSWLRSPEKTLSAILLGNLTANILISELGYGIIEFYSDPSFVNIEIFSMVLITSLLLVFCEIIPKAVALRIPVKWSKALSPFLKAWFFISHYISEPVYRLTRKVTLKLPSQTKSYTERELLDSILLASSYNLIRDSEEKILKRSVLFHHDTTFHAMTPHSRSFMIPHNLSVLKAKKLFSAQNEDTALVYHAVTKKLLGCLHIRNIVLLHHKKT